MRNLTLCSQGAECISNVDEQLLHSYDDAIIPGHSSLFSLEDSLLQLSASNEVDGIFFFVVLKSNNGHCYARYCEYGCYEGAFR